MDEKTTFILYASYKQYLEFLTGEEVKAMFAALFEYAETGKEPNFEGTLGLAFTVIRNQIDIDNKKYQEKVNRRREAGKKGGRPSQTKSLSENEEEAEVISENEVEKEETTKSNAFFEKPKKAKVFSEKQKKLNENGNGNENGNENENGNVFNNIISCSEPSPSLEPPAIELPLNNGTNYKILNSMIVEWSDLYPAVDIMQELRNMKGWLLANPTKRKTKSGIRRFINTWLTKEQDKPHKNIPNSRGEPPKLLEMTETADEFERIMWDKLKKEG